MNEIDTYRAVVIASVNCPFCHADVGEQCTYYNDPVPGDRRTPGLDREILVPVPYVHDDRSMVHHNDWVRSIRLPG